MKYMLKPSVILFIAAALVCALLCFVQAVTYGPIEDQIKKTRDAAMQEVFPLASEFRELDETERTGSITGIFEGLDAGRIVGYVVMLSPDGYDDKIDMLVGISVYDNSITGMRVIRHTETPGLGALAVKEGFHGQYKDRALVTLYVVKKDPSDNDIQAITGATITTVAITDAVNEAIEWYKGGGF
jgi:electron transport complex protein RnfG